MSKKILYITYDGLTDPLGQSQVLPYLEGLSAAGYRITVISFEKPAAFATTCDIITAICRDAGIEWVPLSYTKKPPVLSTLKDIYRLRQKVKELYWKQPFAIVHCRSYITALVGLWVKKKYGARFIFDMRGFWADERVDGNIWNLSNPVYKRVYDFFKRKELRFFQEADYIISLTENGKHEITTNLAANKKTAPIEVIPCCADLSLFNPANVSPQLIKERKRELEIPYGTIVLTYIGSVGTWYMPREMMLFFKTWLIHHPDSIFLIITGDDTKLIRDLAEELSVPLDRLRFTKGKRSEMPLLIACGDYSIFFIKPVFSKKASSPTKQGEIMAMGKPIICNDNVGDTGDIIRRYSAGLVLSSFTPSSFSEKIDELEKLQFNLQQIRTGAQAVYSLESGVKKYCSVYEKVLQA